MNLSPFSHVLFMEAGKQLNRRASKRFALRQAHIGRPFPKRERPDLRPHPWLYDDDPEGDE